jgi:uncharacterized lipoprotein YajG
VTRSVKSRKSTTKLGLAVAATLALSGCGAMHPGAAAVVDSTSISMAQVDALARGVCSASKNQTSTTGPMPSRNARQVAVQILVDSELSRQFGEKRGITPNPSMVSAAEAQFAQSIDALPPGQRADFRQAVRESAEGQLTVVEAGRRSLEAQGAQNISQNQALAEGSRLRQQYERGIEVEVDPRYGAWTKGNLQPGGAELSVPVSAQARAGDNAKPPASWVTQLPASQKCS